MRRALYKIGTQLEAGKLLGADVVREYRLSCLTRKNYHRKLSRTQLLAVLQDFKVLEILDVDRVTLNTAAIQLPFQAFLEFRSFWTHLARLVKTLVPDERCRTQLNTGLFSV